MVVALFQRKGLELQIEFPPYCASSDDDNPAVDI